MNGEEGGCLLNVSSPGSQQPLEGATRRAGEQGCSEDSPRGLWNGQAGLHCCPQRPTVVQASVKGVSVGLYSQMKGTHCEKRQKSQLG